MNDIEQIQQFAVGAVTLAASRNEAIRAEVLRVGDPVRVLVKASYGDPKVHTGVIVGFEPFTSRPTIIVAYVEAEYSKAEMKMLYFTGAEDQKAEILAAPNDVNIDIEASRVIDWFNGEEAKKLAELDELRAKRKYFKRYFGNLMSQTLRDAEAASAEGAVVDHA